MKSADFHRQRVLASIEAARPYLIPTSDPRAAEALTMRLQGWKYDAIAHHFGVHQSAVSFWIDKRVRDRNTTYKREYRRRRAPTRSGVARLEKLSRLQELLDSGLGVKEAAFHANVTIRYIYHAFSSGQLKRPPHIRQNRAQTSPKPLDTEPANG